MANECRKLKKDKEMRKCYKCNKVEHIAEDYRSKQLMKIRRNQEETDESEDDKEEDFVEGLE